MVVSDPTDGIRFVIRFIAFTWGLGAGWAWWVFAHRSSTVTLLVGLLLSAVTVGSFAFMVRTLNRRSVGALLRGRSDRVVAPQERQDQHAATPAGCVAGAVVFS